MMTETFENHFWDVGDNNSYNVTNMYDGAWEDSLWQTVIEDFKNHQLTMSEPPTIVLLVLYVPIFLMSLMGNVIVLFVIIPNQRMWTVTDNFLVNLSVADLLGKILDAEVNFSFYFMLSLSIEYHDDIIKTFNNTSRYLVD